MRALQREFRCRMIKGRRLPRHGVVACRAVVRELRRSVIRLQNGVEIGLVALPAIGVLQLVVAVHVTGLAGLRRMRALQRELRCRMIKGRGLPRRCAVTLRAIVRELRRSVIRLHGCVEIRVVALPAIGVLQLIVAVHVAGLAGLRHMRSLQREFRCRMIKDRGLPRHGVVALRAIVRELRSRVIGLQSGGEIRFVALPAIGVLQLIVAIHVAGLAGLRHMRALQRELRCRMIKGRRLPRHGVVALRAIVRELRRRVIGLQRCGEIRFVALPAIGVLQLVVAVHMAGLAGLRHMRTL